MGGDGDAGHRHRLDVLRDCSGGPATRTPKTRRFSPAPVFPCLVRAATKLGCLLVLSRVGHCTLIILSSIMIYSYEIQYESLQVHGITRRVLKETLVVGSYTRLSATGVLGVWINLELTISRSCNAFATRPRPSTAVAMGVPIVASSNKSHGEEVG